MPVLHAQSAKDTFVPLSFQHVTASVQDLDAEVNWYKRIFGFHEQSREGDAAHMIVAHLVAPGVRIDLVKQNGSVRHRTEAGPLEQGWLHVVFKVPSLDVAYKELKAKGTDVKANLNAEGKPQHLSLHDPEGNEIGIGHD
ncbi:MAG: VOC family protein [Acidobacteriaceae bacterium]|nr:VOC family protein [Acidobacteriaceae bacterium]